MDSPLKDRQRPGELSLPFLAALLLAAALRAWNLQGQSLSMDEVTEASIVRCSVHDIVMYADGFPPLFHLILKPWSSVFPAPETGRWISVVAGVAAVYAVGRWAGRLLGPLGGAVAATLAALSPLHIYLSKEARAYSLYLCFVAFALMFFFAALADNRRRNWAGFVAAMTAGAYTHYYAPAAGLLMGLIFIARRRPWRELRRGLAAFGVVFCLCLPLVVFLLPADVKYQHGYTAKPSFASTMAHTGYALWAGFSLGPSLRELHSMPLRDAAKLIAPWAAIIAAAGGFLLCLGWRELAARINGRAVVFLAVASAPIIGVLGTAAGVGFKVQYWSWIVFPLVVWLAAGVVRGWTNGRQPLTAAACMAIFGLQITALLNRNDNPRFANEDLRETAQYLAAHATPDAPVFIAADYLAPVLRFYLDGEPALHNWLPHMPRYDDQLAADAARQERYWTVVPLSADGSIQEGLVEEAAPRLTLADAISAGREFWFVYSRPFHGDPAGKLPQEAFGGRAPKPTVAFAGVDLYRVIAPQPPSSP